MPERATYIAAIITVAGTILAVFIGEWLRRQPFQSQGQPFSSMHPTQGQPFSSVNPSVAAFGMAILGTILGALIGLACMYFFPIKPYIILIDHQAMWTAEVVAFIAATLTIFGIALLRSDLISMFVYSVSFASSLSATFVILHPEVTDFGQTIIWWNISLAIATGLLHILTRINRTP